MYRKFLWCYVFILTLLDISLNTKLTAQGKSHGVTVQDTLIEGVTFQEWGKESSGQADGADGAEEGAERAGGVRLRPAALHFGRAALAVAHARAVTLTNAANATLHLASVAGTTPDFHASFFEAKTLPPQGNTTFNVVYLGRREGPVSAHLYIHTSLGVHKYPVSAVGVASEYDVWPLVGVRVPANATVEPELTLYNPTDQTIQVSEVYSSGSWVGLRLPDAGGGGAGGAERAPAALWAVPPRAARVLVRLRIAPPDHHHPLTAYIRIKANIPGGGLVVAVEARGAAPGEHARPLQLRLRARGSWDPPHTVAIEAGNSADGAVRLEGALRGAACWATARAPPEPCAAPPPARRLNGGGPMGAHIKLLRSQLDPYQDFTKVAELTLNYAELWAVAVASAGGAAGAGGAVREAWCGGCVRLGRAALPYSVRLLPGSLLLVPDALHFVYAEREVALRTRELRAANEFQQPLRVDAILFPPDMFKYFQVEDLTPLSLKTGESTVLARIKLLESAIVANFTLDSQLVLRTNLSEYTVPLLVYSGKFTFEWEWPQWNSTEIDLGTISADSTLSVPLRLRNAGPAPLCLASVGARLAGAAASLRLDPARLLAANGSAVCVEGGEWVAAQLAVGARGAGAWRGEAWALGPHARSARALRLRARLGRLAPRALALPPAAPYTVSSAEVVVENSMAVSMDVLGVAVAEGEGVLWRPAAERLPPGATALGTVSLAPEHACRPLCYTGLDPASREGQSWVRRSAEPEAGLAADLALLAERLARFERTQTQINFTLLLRTTEVAALALRGSARLRWARLAGARAGRAGAAAAGGQRALRLLLRNPARTPLLLQPALPARRHPLPPLAGGDASECARERCEWAPDAFSLAEWRVTRGRAAPFPAPDLPAPPAPPALAGNGSALPLLLLQPDSEIELKVVFAPQRAASFIAHLYLRNNLTIVEGVQLWGQGAVASFEIGGLRPGSTSPLLFEVMILQYGYADLVLQPAAGSTSQLMSSKLHSSYLTVVSTSQVSECGGAEGAGGAAVVRRAVTVRNTGRVAVRLRDWRVAGRACAARGFRLQPCAPLHLAPNDSRTLTLSYAADYTLARATASLRLRSERGIAEFTLAATTPAKLLSKCAGGARPPWEYSIRAGAWILSIATFVVVLVAGAVDAERMMRHLHASRAASPPRAPLDLRGLAPPPAPPAPAPRAPPRRRRARPRPPPLDPQAERRAFERWRAEVLRRAEREDAAGDVGRTLEDSDGVRPPEARAPSPSPPLDDFEPDPGAPRSSEDDFASSGSDASTPADERDETEAEPYEAENEATTREPSPVRPDDEPLREPANRPRFPVSTDAPPRAVRLRRERTESMRRSERARADSETSHSRSGPAMKHHLRRDKNSKRRAAPAAPARSSPGTIATDCNTEGGTNDADNGSTRGSVRWGASWSSVVGGAAAAPLAPIGSDVRRREGRPAGNDNSLFYFNGDSPHVTASALSGEPDFTWGADRPAYVPAHESYSTPNPDSPFGSGKLDSSFAPKRDNGFGPAAHDTAYSAGSHDSTFVTGTPDSAFAPGTHDYLADKSALSGHAYGALGGALGGVWGGAGGAWPWSAYSAPLRPPPGFGREPVRPYDPFRSLASIWAPGAVDWRPAASAAAPTAPAPAEPRPQRPDRNPEQ